jgi:hypothetical protein
VIKNGINVVDYRQFLRDSVFLITPSGYRLLTGCGGLVSLEGPEGLRILICSRLFTDDEYAAIQSAGRV